MADHLLRHQKIIYQEMMVHPALFTHPSPETIAVITEKEDIVKETLKHLRLSEVWQVPPTTAHDDPRLKSMAAKTMPHDCFDVVIIALDKVTPSHIALYYPSLKKDGLLVAHSSSPFDLEALKNDYDALNALGFFDIQLLSFPQPNDATGWRGAFLATKNKPFRRVREKDIFNKPFTTQYYNLDVHKAALVLPEFMREELAL